MNTTTCLLTCIDLLKRGQHHEALHTIQPLMDMNPTEAQPWTVYGNILLEQNRFEDALDAWKLADSITPQPIVVVTQMAQIAREFGRTKDALQYYARCIELNPTSETVEASGNFLLEIGQLAEAEQLLTLATSTGNLKAVAGMIDLRMKQNRRPEAADLVTQHLQRLTEEPALIQACARLMLAEKELNSALEVLCMIDFHQLPTRSKLVHFRLLGDVLDKLGRHAESFEAYQQFNTMRGCTYDAMIHREYIQTVKDAYDTEQAIQSSSSSNRPIFIVGMPRSGTSLLEQILSMHPKVYGAGELDHIPALVNEYGTSTADGLNRIATEYLTRLRDLNDETPFVTDKLPHNYEHLGNIARIFPNAKVIYCTRDALDSGWSCYRQNFHHSLRFATDLWSIGDYHRQLIALMEHWTECLPISIHPVSYEELVQSPETTLRELCTFLDIEWDPNILHFHTSKRAVHTASSLQVQEPLYTKSIGASSSYTEWLTPLQRGLSGQDKDESSL